MSNRRISFLAWNLVFFGVVLANAAARADDGPRVDDGPRADEQLSMLRARADEQFEQRLKWLAAKCEELELKQQAEITGHWFPVRDPARQYLFVPPPSDPTVPPAAAADVVQQWHRRFLQYRTAYAAELFKLVAPLLDVQHDTQAYQLLHEILREDPNHAEARRILGYMKSGGAWRQPGANSSARVMLAPHPRFGWRARQHWRIDTAHFRISTNDGAQAGLELGRQLEDLYHVWQQLFVRYWQVPGDLSNRLAGAAPAATRQEKHQVVLLKSRDEYLAMLKASQPNVGLSQGIYLYDDRMAVFYSGDERARATWFHEATHQLFQETGSVASGVGRRLNFWIVEGIALYMESLTPHDGYYSVGGVDSSRLQDARFRALTDGFYMPLDQFVALGEPALQTHADIRRLYSQAAGLAHFLMDYQQGRYRDALVDYIRLVYQGRDTPQTLGLLSNASLVELDAQYREFLNVTDADLAHLNPPPLVRNLSLSHTAVTDQGLAQLAEHRELQWLNLAFTATTDTGVAYFKDAAGLTDLYLEKTKITDAALEIIGRFEKLETLGLSLTSVTDAGLAHLTRLSNLTTLTLAGTAVTDAGLEELTNLRKLETLDVRATAVTAEGINRLKQSLPALRIDM